MKVEELLTDCTKRNSNGEETEKIEGQTAKTA